MVTSEDADLKRDVSAYLHQVQACLTSAFASACGSSEPEPLFPSLQLVTPQKPWTKALALPVEERVMRDRALEECEVIQPNWLTQSRFWNGTNEYVYPDMKALYTPWQRELFSWPQIRNQCRRTVLLADPGVGKSWLLRTEACQTAREQQTRLHDLHRDLAHIIIPVYLHLDRVSMHLEEPGATIYTVIADLLQRDYQLSRACRNWLCQHLQHDPTLFLLDGLDAVASTRQQGLRQGLSLLDQTSKSHILVASRYDGYPGFPFVRLSSRPNPQSYANRITLEELEFTGLQPQQIQQMITQVCTARPDLGQHVLARLEQEPQMRWLLRLPHHVLWFCQHAALNPTVSPTRASLYEAVLAALLVIQRPILPPHLSDLALLRILEQVSWQVAIRQEQGQEAFTQQDVLLLLRQAMQQVASGSEEGREDVLWTRLLQMGLFAPYEQQQEGLPTSLYRCQAPELLALLQARYLADQPPALSEQVVQRYLLHPGRWYAVLLVLTRLRADLLPSVSRLQLAAPTSPTLLFLQASLLLETPPETRALETVQQTIKALVQMMQDPSVRNKCRACALLLHLSGADLTRHLLTQFWQPETTPAARSSALWVLGYVHDPAGITLLLTVLRHKVLGRWSHQEQRWLRIAAAWSLGHLGEPRAALVLRQILTNPRETRLLRCAAIWTLGQIGDLQAVPLIRPYLEDRSRHSGQAVDGAIRSAAAWALGRLSMMGVPALIEDLIEDLGEDGFVRYEVLEAFVRHDTRIIPSALKISADPTRDEFLREAAITALGYLGSAWIWETRPQIALFTAQMLTLPQLLSLEEPLIDLLLRLALDANESVSLRLLAAKALRRMGVPSLAVVLLQGVDDPSLSLDDQMKFVEAMGDIGFFALPTLLQLVERWQGETDLRRQHAYYSVYIAIERISESRAVSALLELAQRNQEDLSHAALSSLSSILRRLGVTWHDYAEGPTLLEHIHDLIVPLLQDTTLSSRQHIYALRVLESIGGEHVTTLCLQIMNDHQEDATLRRVAVSVLLESGVQSIATLTQIAHETNDALRALSEIPDPRAHATLLSMLNDPKESFHVLNVLAENQDPLAREPLWALVHQSKDQKEMIDATFALAWFPDEDVTEQLYAIVMDRSLDDHLRGWRYDTITKIGERSDLLASHRLLSLLHHSETVQFNTVNKHVAANLAAGIRGYAAIGLGRQGYAEAMNDLLATLWDKEYSAQQGAAFGLWVMGFPLLLKAAQDLVEPDTS